MDAARRRRLAAGVLEGYPSGVDAPALATNAALADVRNADSVILVEGISDQIALESLSEARGTNLADHRIVVVPMGGAQAIGKFLNRFGPTGADLRVSGLCDAAEERFFLKALAASGVGTATDPAEMQASGFFTCVADLEDELIRAAGRTGIERVLDSHGDLDSFHTLQKQPRWRGKEFDAQMHRWLRAGAGRNLRYARLLTLAMPVDATPAPLTGVLSAAGVKL